MVSMPGMTVSLKTDLRFPITGQQGHESRNIHTINAHSFGYSGKRRLCLTERPRKNITYCNFSILFLK